MSTPPSPSNHAVSNHTAPPVPESPQTAPNRVASPMGEHFELTAAIGGRSQRAVVTEIAASLRELDVDGIALVQDYPADAQPPWCSGWVLVPWPNRVAGGTWIYDGVAQQLDITEPELGNALHGLLTRAAYRIAARTPDSITLDAAIPPQAGYPFKLATSVRYELTEDGLLVTHRVENAGIHPAPVAIGAHPFLRLGTVPTEELTLYINADTHIEVDERLNPSGITTNVSGTPYDFREGQLVGKVDLDDAWGDVRRKADGSSVHYLEAPDGSQVHMFMDASFGYVQAFTTMEYAADGGMVTAVAVEPMTAPADAFNSGEGLRWLEPGEAWEARWGIRHQQAG